MKSVNSNLILSKCLEIHEKFIAKNLLFFLIFREYLNHFQEFILQGQNSDFHYLRRKFEFPQIFYLKKYKNMINHKIFGSHENTNKNAR